MSMKVMSSPACHKAASWRSRQKNATLQLYRIRHCVKLRLSMTSRPRQIHSKQNPFTCHDYVQSCTKSKKASRTTSKKLLTPSSRARHAAASWFSQSRQEAAGALNPQPSCGSSRKHAPRARTLPSARLCVQPTCPAGVASSP